jgi:hypothetical protein
MYLHAFFHKCTKDYFIRFFSKKKLSIDLHMTAEHGNIRQSPVLD